MAKRIRTIEDVKNVPATERILMVNFSDGTCPFCGTSLPSQIVGFGRHKTTQYGECFCAVSHAARKHNYALEQFSHEEWLRELKQREQKEEKCRQEEANKPVVITAAQMFCVASGRILPGISPMMADDTVGGAMRRIGFFNGSARDRLFAYAEQHGFVAGLKQASVDMASYVKGATWETDISKKELELCQKYNVPQSLSL